MIAISTSHYHFKIYGMNLSSCDMLTWINYFWSVIMTGIKDLDMFCKFYYYMKVSKKFQKIGSFSKKKNFSDLKILWTKVSVVTNHLFVFNFKKYLLYSVFQNRIKFILIAFFNFMWKYSMLFNFNLKHEFSSIYTYKFAFKMF